MPVRNRVRRVGTSRFAASEFVVSGPRISERGRPGPASSRYSGYAHSTT